MGDRFETSAFIRSVTAPGAGRRLVASPVDGLDRPTINQAILASI